MSTTLNSDLTSTLPPYSPSRLAPSYCAEPAHDEHLLELGPQSKPRLQRSGNLIKRSGSGDTLILSGQDPDTEAPTYGRSAVIAGFVGIEERESVGQVSLTISGKIELTAADSSIHQTILEDTQVLWSANDNPSENRDMPAQCPGHLTFTASIPVYFQHADDHERYPLPPTFLTSYPISGGLSAKISYTISATIVRARRRGGLRLSSVLGPKITNVIIPFNYVPRSYPSRPIPLTSEYNFLSEIKAMPDEWHQLCVVVNPRPGVRLPAVDLHLFTPISGIFALGTPIPIRIQLIGSVDSLREFIPDNSGFNTTNLPRSRIEVSLVRQLRLQVHGSTESARSTIGRAFLLSVPPPAPPPPPPSPSLPDFSRDPLHPLPSHEFQSQHDLTNTFFLDFAAQLHIDTTLGTTSSFNAAIVQVQDFIVIDVLEPAGPKSVFAHTREARRVRLVTDEYPGS
ncbi:hypothetical protein R3P38DRAFT_3175675 [Favolaschia claudopus]|uniref:Arrestin-like N-terminal domain-containing protein n=1 Tax=Favolaschia claudopus TaxID=2862362 RepID=A0AAW0D5L6_9AGAR